MGRAENGIVSDEVHSIPYPFTSECNLKITTREQQLAFLELYGYWLGDGSILVKRGKPESITFNIVKKTDAEWLEKTFRILNIHNRSSYKNSKEYEMPDVSDGVYKIPRQTQYVIKIFDESYKKFFFDEYLAKYMKTDASSDRVKDFADVAKMINRNTCESTINTDTSLHVSNNTEVEEIKSAKWLMSWVWGLSKDSARAIINGIVLADGSHHKGKALKHIFTSSTRFRDEVERLAFHAGYAPYSTVCYLAGSVRGQRADGKPITANHTLWSVNFPENEQFSEPTLKREENDIKYIKYTGRTWCVSMPSTFIVARRARCVNGIVSHASRPLVIGNCLQDCDLVVDLYRKLETFNNSMSMANVCTVPVSYIFTRGQGIKIESLIFKFCQERGIVIPVLPVPSAVEAEDSFEGAIVLDPEPGFYSTSPIGVCDFASLYPSTIVSENISHDSLLWIKDFTNDGALICHKWGSELYDECDGYAYTDIEFDIIRPDPSDERKHKRKVKCGRRICRYAQPLDGSKSTLPQITNWLLTARSVKKKEMKAEKDPERYALLDAEQLAYKLTGNSLYGQLGSGTFKIRLQALAASVTAYGRKQILFAKAAIEQFYGPGANLPNCNAKIVYGDTDSIFVEFNPRNPETGERLEGREARVATIEMTDEAGHFITKTLAAPHDFEFDKAFDPLLMFSKKRYAGNMYEANPDDYVHKYMGIALKRRDNAPIVKTIFGGAMKMLLDKRDVSGAFQFVKDKCLELVDGKVSLGQLTVTKSLRADYADPGRIAHKALADRITKRDPGNAPAAGDRIGYVYIRPLAGQEASKLQGDRIETPLYIKEHQLVPDYRHYIEHQLQNPISQAFALLLESIPGFKREMVKGCPTAVEDLDRYLGFREARAAELLFSDCLKRFETASKRSAMATMFGGNAIITPMTRSKTTVMTAAPTAASAVTKAVSATALSAAPKVTPKVAVQSSISNYLLDSFLVSNIRKKERQAKKKKLEEKQEEKQDK
jgi:DNA polymerase elongation subunit (family B)